MYTKTITMNNIYELKKEYSKKQFFEKMQKEMGNKFEATKCFEIVSSSVYNFSASFKIKVLESNKVSIENIFDWAKNAGAEQFTVSKETINFVMDMDFEKIPTQNKDIDFQVKI